MIIRFDVGLKLMIINIQNAKMSVHDGSLPCTKELAMILAATRIHIEDLARLGKFQTPPRPFPNVKAKGMIPVTLKVG